MNRNDFTGKAVVVTGGTQGIGLAIGLAFGQLGAEVYLTHKWGSADEDAVRGTFRERGAPEPRIVDADVTVAEDVRALCEVIRERHEAVEVFVSNASFAALPDEFDDLDRRMLFRSLEYGAWPLIAHLQAIHETLGRYPRYTLGISSNGVDSYLPRYEYVAASKAVMETFCRYVAKELFEQHGARVNVLRASHVSTESLRATFGEEFEPFGRDHHGDEFFVDAEDVGSAAVALCGGLMDAVVGQVILLDHGAAFRDNTARRYELRDGTPGPEGDAGA
jgi:NAD(P)-dependent dehydrogenase (short-subunit alcohol dehydrogenase family)